MIADLRINNLGVIAECDLELSPGMVVFTGETGAGKTVLVGALGLVLGDRADTSLVSGERAEVSAQILIRSGGPIANRVEQAGGSLDPDGGLAVARTILESGRSRAAMGGAAVPVSLLAEVGSQVAQRHSQSDQLRLRSRRRQRESLDAFAGPKLLSAMHKYHESYREYVDAVAELQNLREQRQSREFRIKELEQALARIDDVRPVANEESELPERISRLANVEQLAQDSATALSSLEREEGGALAEFATAIESIARMASLDPQLMALRDRCGELSILLDEVFTDVSRYATELSADPNQLAALQQRRAALNVLQRDFGPSLVEVLAWAETAREELGTLTNADDDEARLEEMIEQLLDTLTTTGQAVSDLRIAAAKRLAKAVTKELHELSMPNATFRVDVTQQEVDLGLQLADGRTVAFGESGIDTVAFMLAPHPGAVWAPVGEGASGGELSRIMLSLEVVLAEADPPAVFVFDEVDAGIGGKTAIEVGRRLSSLAQRSQVLVVTHLPQVAAFADQHVVVTKNTDGRVTRTSVKEVTGSERNSELARMLSGSDGSDAATAHATELLDLADQHRGAGV